MGKSLKGKELGKGISQRTDGTYQARFVNRFGKRQTLYDTTLSGIRRKMRDAQYEDENKLNTDIPAVGNSNVNSFNITLDEWFEIWITTCKKNCRKNSKYTYTNIYNRVKKDLGGRKLKQINLLMVQEVFNNFETDEMRKSTKRVLVDIFQRAVDSDILDKNIIKKVNTKIDLKDAAPPRVLSQEEITAFLEFAEKTVFYNLYVVALETGMRVGELAGLRWKDIDFEKNCINVQVSLCREPGEEDGEELVFHPCKTNSSKRIIPMTQKCREALIDEQKINKRKDRKYGEEKLKGYGNLVFRAKQNNPINPSIINYHMSVIINEANYEYPDLGMESFGPHAFRHYFATKAIERGMNPKSLQSILGHKTIKMTMDRYCHSTSTGLAEEMEKMETA